MPKPEKRLTLEIVLHDEDVDDFLKLAQTDDPSLLQGIARSLVLGSMGVVIPADVASEIDLLVQLQAYGVSDSEKPSQDLADFLLFTREQLRMPGVKTAIQTWASSLANEIARLEQQRQDTPTDHQVEWYRMHATMTLYVGFLLPRIARAITRT